MSLTKFCILANYLLDIMSRTSVTHFSSGMSTLSKMYPRNYLNGTILGFQTKRIQNYIYLNNRTLSNCPHLNILPHLLLIMVLILILLLKTLPILFIDSLLMKENQSSLQNIIQAFSCPNTTKSVLDRYSDTIFLIRQITKQHQKCNRTWNHISDQS